MGLFPLTSIWHFLVHCRTQSMEFSSRFQNWITVTNKIWLGLAEFVPPMWQARSDSVSFISASPATAVHHILPTLAKFRYVDGILKNFYLHS